MKKTLQITPLLLISFFTNAQTDSNKEMFNGSCECIEKINSINRTSEEKNNDVKNCIESQIRTHSFTSKLESAMKDAEDNNKKEINISIDSSAKQYGSDTYFQLETELMENCEAMQIIVKSNDYIFTNSITDNEKSYKQYIKGQELYSKKDYQGAMKAYEKALEIDPVFAFAWDNLGLTYRRLEKYDLALDAYRKSLELVPNGFMPLQNIPVVYEMQEKYDEALEAYKNINNLYPENAEADYGMGRIYIFHKKDLTKGLDYICKAYNKYVSTNSPYRVDAEKIMGVVYQELKKNDQLHIFKEVLEKNNINME